MRILLVSDYGHLAGGAELQIAMLRERLRSRGHEVRFLATAARPRGDESIADRETFGTTSSFRTALQSWNPWAARAISREIREFRPDVVHVFLFLTQLSPAILPALRGTPSLYYAVWYRAVCPRGTKLLPDGRECGTTWGRECLRRRCIPLRDAIPLLYQMRAWYRGRPAFDRIVANSEATRDRLTGSGIEVDDVVPPGVPVLPLGRPLAPEPTVVFAGRLVPEKGVDTLVRAFAEVVRRVPDARLRIAGDGPERDAIGNRARSLGVAPRVDLIGTLSHEALQASFAGAWVQAVPSRWAEPFGMVAAEAMMRGTAVVATGTGGLREIVADGETGRLVPPDDPGALAAAIVDLLADRGRVDRMGRRGREVAVERFGVEAHVDRFEALYRELSGGESPAGSGSGPPASPPSGSRTIR